MMFPDYLSLLKSLADNWWVAVLLPAVIFALHREVRLRPYVSGLRLPALFLFLRKALLFVPVCGAVSTPDRVLFWSERALLFYGVMLLVAGLIILTLRNIDRIPNDTVGGWLSIALMGALFGTPFLLLSFPVGWEGLYLGPLSTAVALKVLIVSPALLPLAGLGLALQAGLALCAAGGGARELNKLLCAAVLLGGLSHAVLQPAAGTPPQVMVLTRPAVMGTHLLTWVRELREVNATGVMSLERELPGDTGSPGSARLAAIPPPWLAALGAFNPALAGIAGVAILVLLLLAERLPADRIVPRVLEHGAKAELEPGGAG